MGGVAKTYNLENAAKAEATAFSAKMSSRKEFNSNMRDLLKQTSSEEELLRVLKAMQSRMAPPMKTGKVEVNPARSIGITE